MRTQVVAVVGLAIGFAMPTLAQQKEWTSVIETASKLMIQ